MFRLIFSYSASEIPGSLYTKQPQVSMLGAKSVNSSLTIEGLTRDAFDGACTCISFF